MSYPKYLHKITSTVAAKKKLVKETSSELLDVQQSYYDGILEIYRDAFNDLIINASTYSGILNEIMKAYENAIKIRNERINQFIIQDKIFGISANKQRRNDKIKSLVKENEDLQQQIIKLNSEVAELNRVNSKLTDNEFREYLSLARERDARYQLFAENMSLHIRVRALDGSAPPADHSQDDPVVLRIALDKCREQLSATQRELKRMREEYSETVPRREHDALSLEQYDAARRVDTLRAELHALQDSFKKIAAAKKSIEEELAECRERCGELERCGTPRPHWDLCADYIGGGRDRWWQLSRGLSSRAALRVLLKELGPAAHSDHQEYFTGLGTDPSVPPYLRYEGRVRNLRLSRREVAVLINDVWLSKLQHGMDMTMQDYVTKYFEDRYQQSSVRAEWAYNLCAGLEQQLDEPAVRLFRGALLGALDEQLYWGLRHSYTTLRDQLYAQAKDRETVTIEEFEKVAKTVFPLKSEVDIRSLSDVVRRQLKMKLTTQDVRLDKLFAENEEGFERLEIGRELWRQRRAAQDKYLREVVAELRARTHAQPVTQQQLKRAIAIVDPAIDHVRMDRILRWAFGATAEGEVRGEVDGAAVVEGGGGGPARPLRALLARLAAADVPRAGPRRPQPLRHRNR